MTISRGVLEGSGNKFKEANKSASHVYNSAGVSLQQYCSTRETQYLDLIEDAWEMVELAGEAIGVYIDENW